VNAGGGKWTLQAVQAASHSASDVRGPTITWVAVFPVN
jgi:hypothetical protein